MKFPIPNGKTAVAPSLLSADMWRMGEQVKQVEAAGAAWLHVDIMDGHFVPNLSFGPTIPAAIKGKTALPMDVHLMVEYPSKFIEPFFKAGADALTVHIECKEDALALVKQIKSLGIAAGISIKPDTDPSALIPFLPHIDLILVMSVYPGFGGQGYLEKGHENIKAVRALINESGRKIWLEADGGINKETAARAVAAGADALVAGNAVFAAPDPGLAVKDLLEIVK